MANYIEISQTGNMSGALRYAVLVTDDVLDDGYTQPTSFDEATLDGPPVLSFGPGGDLRRYTIIFPWTGAASGWANYANAKALFNTNTIAGNALLYRAMIDNSPAQRSGLLVNKGQWQPRCLTFEKYTTAAIYTQELVIRQT